MKNGDLLYILHVPQLENSTSTIIRVYPLIVDNQIIKSYPSHVIRHRSKLFVTDNPKDIVQKSANIKELEDECLKQIILGKHSRCNSIFKNDTTHQLVNENTIIISNAKHHLLETSCGPDNRRITGNFIVKFSNCTVNFIGQTFQNSESTVNMEILYGAIHNTSIHWHLIKQHDIAAISDTAVSNRQQLSHVYLRQDSLHLKLWTMFGGFSFSTILVFVIIGIVIKYICENRTNGPGRSVLKGDVVTDGNGQNPEGDSLADISIRLQRLQQQLQQLPNSPTAAAPLSKTSTP